MRKILKCVVPVLLIFFICSPAYATKVFFNDNHTVWDGWGTAAENSKDTIGLPDYLGGYADVTSGGYLKELSFRIKDPLENATLWELVAPSDLFIDRDANDTVGTTWDLLVDVNGSKDAGSYGLYDINQPLNGTGYNMSHMAGYNFRDDHPIGLDVTGLPTPTKTATFSGWPGAPGDSEVSVSFVFGDTDILLGESFTIGFTIDSCANDVVYETLSVPEPATMLLVGSCLLGLAGFGRRRFIKK